MKDDYDPESRGAGRVRPITRERAAEMIYAETGSMARAAVPLQGAVRRNMTGAEAARLLEDQVLDGGQHKAEARSIGARRAARFGAVTMTGYEALIDLFGQVEIIHHYGDES